jgi:hypothetical protein
MKACLTILLLALTSQLRAAPANEGVYTVQLPITNSVGQSNRVILVIPGLGTNDTWTIPTEDLLGSMRYGRSVWVATNGNNTLARREYIRPFADPYAGGQAALPGDTVFVLPGDYNTNNIAKNGINWHFFPGARVSWTDTNGAIAPGIIDDRYVGAVTSTITGSGEFYVRAMSNEVENLNLHGTIVLTNPLSRLHLKCKRLDGTFLNQNNAAILYAKNGNTFVEADVLEDPFSRTNYYYDDGMFVAIPAFTSGIYWVHGDLHTRIQLVRTTAYGFYGLEEAPFATNSESWYHEGDLIDNEPVPGQLNGGGNAVFYTVATTPFWKCWWTAREIRAAGGWNIFGGGRLYLTAQKFGKSVNDGGAAFAITQTGTNETWITLQKLSAPGKFISVASPNVATVHANILQYEPLAGLTVPAFDIQTGTLDLNDDGLRATNVVSLVNGSHTKDTGFAEGIVGIPNASTRTNRLPAASAFPGRTFTIYDAGGTAGGAGGSTNIWITTASGTFTGGASQTNITANHGSITVQSDGANWRILSKFP